jgi:hypothetical protein
MLPATRPLAPSAATARRVRTHCAAITRSAPNSHESATNRSELERLLMRVLKTADLRSVEQVIRAAAVPGLTPTVEGRPVARLRRWVAQPAGTAAQLRIAVYSGRDLQYVSVSWSALPAVLKTRRERELHQLQEQFYARYMAAGERAYATPPRRISAADRRLLLVGEFEADVNNGGFSQYLGNQGRRRAAETLRVLEEIAAPKTAALLRAAMADAANDAALQKLDARFYRSREDLALLSIRAAPR